MAESNRKKPAFWNAAGPLAVAVCLVLVLLMTWERKPKEASVQISNVGEAFPLPPVTPEIKGLTEDVDLLAGFSPMALADDLADAKDQTVVVVHVGYTPGLGGKIPGTTPRLSVETASSPWNAERRLAIITVAGVERPGDLKLEFDPAKVASYRICQGGRETKAGVPFKLLVEYVLSQVATEKPTEKIFVARLRLGGKEVATVDVTESGRDFEGASEGFRETAIVDGDAGLIKERNLRNNSDPRSQAKLRETGEAQGGQDLDRAAERPADSRSTLDDVTPEK